MSKFRPSRNKSRQQEISAIAQKYGLIPARVQKIIDRLLPHFDDAQNACPFLDLALGFASDRKKALHVFESEDVQSLVLFSLYLIALNDKKMPLYTLAELCDHIYALLMFLEKNKKHLILTGYPQGDFQDSPFLNWLLTRILPLKLPHSEDYIDPKITPDTELFYQKEIRPSILDTTMNVLQRLRSALSLNFSAKPFEECINLICECLPSAVLIEIFLVEEIWLKMIPENAYYVCGCWPNHLDLGSCTMYNLITFIGHCKMELSPGIGTMRETRERLQAISKSQNVDLVFYSQAFGQTWREDLDYALNEFKRLYDEQSAFWDNYLIELEKVMLTEALIPIFGHLIKKKFIPTLQKRINDYASLEIAHLNIYGRLTSPGDAREASSIPCRPATAEEEDYIQKFIDRHGLNPEQSKIIRCAWENRFNDGLTYSDLIAMAPSERHRSRRIRDIFRKGNKLHALDEFFDRGTGIRFVRLRNRST